MWNFNLLDMPPITINLGESKGYSDEEEYRECKRWAYEISLLSHDGPSEHVPVDTLISNTFRGDVADITETLKAGGLGGCLRSIGKNKFCVWFPDLRHAIKLANHILSPVGGRHMTLACFLFSLIVASYVVVKDRNSGCLDLLKVLDGGQLVENIPRVYTMDELGTKLHIGMLSKLLGILEPHTKFRMDCPRVLDLHEVDVVDNPNLGRVKDFFPIVVVTHRWVEGEITYADILEERRADAILQRMGHGSTSAIPSITTRHNSPGSDKLVRLIDELQELSVRYVWMDTLCIDKTSSAETDEAIRSMYRWYSEAHYVYLESGTSLEDWATRGWTLQEGAAARCLRVSTKCGNSFMELLCKEEWEDSRVRRLGLEGSYMPSSPMYWIHLMDSRNTTKVEDKAYALVGLLELDFQSAYGEGGRATTRLYEELAKQKRDVTWLMGPKFRNGKWTNPKHTRDGGPYEISMREVCYRKNLVESYEETPIIGPTLKVDAIEVDGECLDNLLQTGINSKASYHDTFGISFDCESLLKKVGSERKYWWVPSNNILLHLCRYNTKANAKEFWRVISVRGASDAWIPPRGLSEKITVDYDTAVYKPDPMDDIRSDDIDDVVKSMGRNLEC